VLQREDEVRRTLPDARLHDVLRARRTGRSQGRVERGALPSRDAGPRRRDHRFLRRCRDARDRALASNRDRTCVEPLASPVEPRRSEPATAPRLTRPA
jgi:hypothetical protein